MKELREFIGNRFFFARWEMKNGEIREGTFRFGVKQWKTPAGKDKLDGSGMSYEPYKKGLIPVFDISKAKRGRRPWTTIRLEGLRLLKCGKFHFETPLKRKPKP